MPVIETLTITLAAGAFGFLAVLLWRRRAMAREQDSLQMHMAEAGEHPAALRTGNPVPGSAEEREGSPPLAMFLADQPLFLRLADRISDAVLLHDDMIRYSNPAADALLLEPGKTLAGRRFTDLVLAEHQDVFSAWLSARRSGRQSAVRLLMRARGDTVVECELTGFPSFGEQRILGTVLRASGAESRPSAAGPRLAEATLESISEGVIITNADGNIHYLNPAAEVLLGCDRERAAGRKLNDLATLVDEIDRRVLADPVARCLDEHRRVDLGRRALLVSRASGNEFSVELRASPVVMAEEERQGCAIVLHDMSEIRGHTRQMSYQASHDPLTGLVNRREFEIRLEEAMKTGRSGAGHVLCFLDLDRFKVVNDTSGHTAGDNMLRELAGILKEKVRDSDVVARVGGDEFGMLLIGCPLDKSRQIADDVCAAVRDFRFVWRDRIFSVGVSIGLVQIGAESGSMEDALSAADSACYVAKQQGRGRVHVYSARDEAVARQRGEIAWLQRLQAALKENRFELHTQPIVALGGDPATGPACEVLLRLRDAEGKESHPPDFMHAAERYHLMPTLDRWVLQTAFSAIAGGVLKLPKGRSVAVNVSSQTLADPQFLEFVVDCLDRTGVQPGQVCFELAEAAVAAHLSHASRFIAVLHGLGCRFALDDFGSGLGSFTNLKKLSLDYLKIDGSFIRGIHSDNVSMAMVTAMIELARSLGIQVVAEHVETEHTFELVRALRFEFAQGYAVGRPSPLPAKAA